MPKPTPDTSPHKCTCEFYMDEDDRTHRRANPTCPVHPADTSPGDELDDALYELHDIDCMSGWPGKLDCNCKVKEAKDRLNRLMLTERRKELEKLDDYVGAHEADTSSGARIAKEIATAIAAIDAQLNKEETR